MPKQVLLTAVAVLLLLSASASSQVVPNPETDEIVRRAAVQMLAYVETFKNLLSQETRTFEIYDRDGDVKKRRVVRSTFIVYQLSKDPDKIIEYRNVYSVDGKDLTRTESRAQDFFEKLVRVESSAKELQNIQDESLRFDLEIYISNMTLFQSVALSEAFRPSFDFKFAGSETFDGRKVYLLDYRQVAASPSVSIGAPNGEGKAGLKYDVDLEGLKNLNERLAGQLWIDAETFQIVREHRVLTIQPEGFEARVPVSENWFEFQKSTFGILTPKKISHLQYDIDKKKRTSWKDVQIVFEYDRFTKPDVDVKASEVKNP